MPYILIKGFPKDEQTRIRVAEKINEVFLKEWGCPQEAISIGIVAVDPSEWMEKVKIPEVDANSKNLLIWDGKRTY